MNESITYRCRSCGNPTTLPVACISYCGWCYEPDMQKMPDGWVDGVLFLDEEKSVRKNRRVLRKLCKA